MGAVSPYPTSLAFRILRFSLLPRAAGAKRQTKLLWLPPWTRRPRGPRSGAHEDLGISGENAGMQGPPGNSQENLKTSRSWRNLTTRHVARMCVICAPENVDFCAQNRRFCSGFAAGLPAKSPVWRKTLFPQRLTRCTLLYHEATEVSHGCALAGRREIRGGARKFAGNPEFPANRACAAYRRAGAGQLWRSFRRIPAAQGNRRGDGPSAEPAANGAGNYSFDSGIFCARCSSAGFWR